MEKKILCLFDVDGTLTKSRQKIETDFEKFLIDKVRPKTAIGLVGGSDFNKIDEQMNGDIINKYDYVFSENGLVAYKNGNELEKQSIQKFIGEDKLQEFINFVLLYLSGIVLPIKRGTFVEFRTGMINVSPIGRSCSQQERDEFEKYDNLHQIRSTMIKAIEKKFPDLDLKYSIGGQISFDAFPIGWDKTYCLTHLQNEEYEEIHFFGDKTELGGNDHEIFNDTRVIGHKVYHPSDTKKQVEELLSL